MQINIACKDYDSISQHSHQSTRTTGPQGGRGANHDHAQGGGRGRSDAGASIHLSFDFISKLGEAANSVRSAKSSAVSSSS